jgi:hypothetical protein
VVWSTQETTGSVAQPPAGFELEGVAQICGGVTQLLAEVVTSWLLHDTPGVGVVGAQLCADAGWLLHDALTLGADGVVGTQVCADAGWPLQDAPGVGTVGAQVCSDAGWLSHDACGSVKHDPGSLFKQAANPFVRHEASPGAHDPTCGTLTHAFPTPTGWPWHDAPGIDGVGAQLVADADWSLHDAPGVGVDGAQLVADAGCPLHKAPTLGADGVAGTQLPGPAGWSLQDAPGVGVVGAQLCVDAGWVPHDALTIGVDGGAGIQPC